jgi:hypothetical protein
MEAPGIASELLPVVPAGLFVSRISNPGLRSGLSSAVPAGLILQSPGSHAHALVPALGSAQHGLQTSISLSMRPDSPSEFGLLTARRGAS